MSEESTKDRSPRAPAFSLEKCIDAVTKLHLGCRRNAVDIGTAAKAMGFNTVHGGVLTLLASLREYGLIERPEGKVVATALAIKIIHPISDQQKSEAIKEAALTPKIYSTLLKDFGDCAENVVESHLVQSGFNPDRAKQVAKAFIANKTFAKLESGSNFGVLELEGEVDPSAEKAKKDAKAAASALALASRSPHAGTGSNASNSTITPPSGNSFSFKGEMLAQYNIPLGANQAYLAFTGKELVPEDFDALIDFVEFTKKQFERALRAAKAAEKEQEILDTI